MPVKIEYWHFHSYLITCVIFLIAVIECKERCLRCFKTPAWHLNVAKQVPTSPTSGDQPVGSTFNVGFDVFGRVCDVNVETS